MKIYFEITDTTAAIATTVDSIKLTIEKNQYYLEEVLTLTNRVTIAQKEVSGLNTTMSVWIDMPCEIQGVGVIISEVYTALLFQELGNNKNVTFKNFNRVNVVEFMAGKSYLIPYTAGAVTDMIPDSTILPIEQTIDMVFAGTHYNYNSASNDQCRKGIEFAAIIFEVDVRAVLTTAKEKSIRKGIEGANFISNIA